MRQDMNLPDGTFGTADPNDPDVTTLWWVVKGKMKSWPPKHRWAPFPPQPPEYLKGVERGEWRESWYSRIYWPWKHAVIDAIAADLKGAAARFAEHVPAGERPVIPAPKEKPKTDKEIRQALQVVRMQDSGKSLAQIADELGVPKTTAWRRAQEGRELYATLEAELARIRKSSPFLLAADLFEKIVRDS